MNNHIHLIWQPLQNQTLSTIQHSFLKHTAQVFKADLLKTNPTLIETKVKATLIEHTNFGERNSLSLSVSSRVFKSKIGLHTLNLLGGFANYPEDYHYSSAKFYFDGVDAFDMLSHANE
ncbi:MAG: hypothetical protein IPP48_10785 [Chitinophagaceae bacterium]|nr:hypothetical protein [Chitinophagaceae bacterium]